MGGNGIVIWYDDGFTSLLLKTDAFGIKQHPKLRIRTSSLGFENGPYRKTVQRMFDKPVSGLEGWFYEPWPRNEIKSRV